MIDARSEFWVITITRKFAFSHFPKRVTIKNNVCICKPLRMMEFSRTDLLTDTISRSLRCHGHCRFKDKTQLTQTRSHIMNSLSFPYKFALKKAERSVSLLLCRSQELDPTYQERQY